MGAYGLLTTLYYSVAVTAAWLMLPAQTGLGWQLALRRLGGAFTSAWLVSQVSKVPRMLGCAHSTVSAASCCAGARVLYRPCAVVLPVHTAPAMLSFVPPPASFPALQLATLQQP